MKDLVPILHWYFPLSSACTRTIYVITLWEIRVNGENGAPVPYIGAIGGFLRVGYGLRQRLSSIGHMNWSLGMNRS